MTGARKNGREAETKEEIDRCEERKLGDERQYENDTDGDTEQCHLKKNVYIDRSICLIFIKIKPVKELCV